METILDSEYRKEITGKRLKKLREFLLDYHSVTLREEPSGKEQIIELSSFPVTWISEYTRLLIPGKKGKRVAIDFETVEEAEKFFMIVGRKGRAESMWEDPLMREWEERKKSR